MKCHFAIGPSRAGCRGGGGAQGINGKESVVTSVDCGEVVCKDVYVRKHVEADFLDVLVQCALLLCTVSPPWGDDGTRSRVLTL